MIYEPLKDLSPDEEFLIKRCRELDLDEEYWAAEKLGLIIEATDFDSVCHPLIERIDRLEKDENLLINLYRALDNEKKLNVIMKAYGCDDFRQSDHPELEHLRD